MKIVETNISYSEKGVEDHQTRVLEISSWEEYCNLYKNYNGDPVGDKYKCVFNQMIGYTLPKNATIVDLKIDDFHLTCDMKLWNGYPEYKLVFIVER